MYKMVGNLSDRDMGMLEERIKRVSKSRPPPGSSTNGGPPSAASMMPPPPEPVLAAQPSEIPSRPNSGDFTRFKKKIMNILISRVFFLCIRSTQTWSKQYI